MTGCSLPVSLICHLDSNGLEWHAVDSGPEGARRIPSRNPQRGPNPLHSNAQGCVSIVTQCMFSCSYFEEVLIELHNLRLEGLRSTLLGQG